MDSFDHLLRKADDLLVKARRLNAVQKKLSQDLQAKDDKILLLQNELSEKENLITQLEQEVASLRLGSLINISDGEKKEVKQKINEYLKEIDKVIAKLSTEG